MNKGDSGAGYEAVGAVSSAAPMDRSGGGGGVDLDNIVPENVTNHDSGGANAQVPVATAVVSVEAQGVQALGSEDAHETPATEQQQQQGSRGFWGFIGPFNVFCTGNECDGCNCNGIWLSIVSCCEGSCPGICNDCNGEGGCCLPREPIHPGEEGGCVSDCDGDCCGCDWSA